MDDREHPRISDRKKAVALLRYLGAAVFAALVMAISVDRGSSGRYLARAASPGIEARIDAIRSRFDLLRVGRTRRPPDYVVRGLGSTRSFGLSLPDAAQLRLADGPSLWMIPGANRSCIAWTNQPQAAYAGATYAATCVADGSLVKAGAYVVLTTDQRETVVGVQPGNSVTLIGTASDGGNVWTRLLHGVFTLNASRPRFITSILTLNDGYRPLVEPPQWL